MAPRQPREPFPSMAQTTAAAPRQPEHSVKSKTASKTPTAAPKAKAKDLKARKDAKGGIGMLLPAVQKVREAAG